MTGRELYDLAGDVFEAAGHPTQRTKPPGQTLGHGFTSPWATESAFRSMNFPPAGEPASSR